MAADLHSEQYSWIGSAYALTSTALIPWTGGLAAIFGRRVTMVSVFQGRLLLDWLIALRYRSSALSSSSRSARQSALLRRP